MPRGVPREQNERATLGLGQPRREILDGHAGVFDHIVEPRNPLVGIVGTNAVRDPGNVIDVQAAITISLVAMSASGDLTRLVHRHPVSVRAHEAELDRDLCPNGHRDSVVPGGTLGLDRSARRRSRRRAGGEGYMGSSLSQRPGRVSGRRAPSQLPRTDGPVRPNGGLDAAQLLSLQRLVGNKAVSDLIEQSRSPVLDVIGRPGRPLDPSLRQRMEERFGEDLSSVKIHSDAEAADSAQSVGAIAYTAGENIVLGAGQADTLRSAQGETMLAHELVHVIQQRNGPVDGTPAPGGIRISDPGDRFERQAEAVASNVTSANPMSVGETTTSTTSAGSEAVTVQRLEFTDTNWNDVQRAKLSEEGSGGALILYDNGGTPLVVKAGEEAVPEAQVAAWLQSSITRGVAGGWWTGGAPDVRPVTNAEAKAIKAKVDAKTNPMVPKVVGTDSKAKEDRFRRDTFMQNLGDNKGVLIFAFASGKGMDKVIGEKQTKKKFGRKRKWDKQGLAYQMMYDADLLTLFGRVAAADIVMDNGDRLYKKFNMTNMMVDVGNKSLHLIDNIQLSEAALLRNFGDNNDEHSSGKYFFGIWAKQQQSTQALANGDYGDLADRILNGSDGLRTQLVGDTQLEGLLRTKDRKLAARTFAKQEQFMLRCIEDGLRDGTADTIKLLLENTGEITQRLAGEEREQVTTNLLARGYFLQGETEDDAWDKAELAVGKRAGEGLRAMRRNHLNRRRRDLGQGIFTRIGQLSQSQ